MKKKEINNQCIVEGCVNEKHQGGFMGDICVPCYNMITTGKIGNSTNFVAKLKEQNELLKSLLRNATIKIESRKAAEAADEVLTEFLYDVDMLRVTSNLAKNLGIYEDIIYQES